MKTKQNCVGDSEIGNCVVLGAAQDDRCIYGLRRFPPKARCSIGRDLSFAAMDAPQYLPAGSMLGDNYLTGPRCVQERIVTRGSVVHKSEATS